LYLNGFFTIDYSGGYPEMLVFFTAERSDVADD